MPLACKVCIATKGLKGSELGSLPETEEELFDHIEDEHGMVVKRKGETEEQAKARFTDKRAKKSCECGHSIGVHFHCVDWCWECGLTEDKKWKCTAFKVAA